MILGMFIRKPKPKDTTNYEERRIVRHKSKTPPRSPRKHDRSRSRSRGRSRSRKSRSRSRGRRYRSRSKSRSRSRSRGRPSYSRDRRSPSYERRRSSERYYPRQPNRFSSQQKYQRPNYHHGNYHNRYQQQGNDSDIQGKIKIPFVLAAGLM